MVEMNSVRDLTYGPAAPPRGHSVTGHGDSAGGRSRASLRLYVTEAPGFRRLGRPRWTKLEQAARWRARYTLKTGGHLPGRCRLRALAFDYDGRSQQRSVRLAAELTSAGARARRQRRAAGGSPQPAAGAVGGVRTHQPTVLHQNQGTIGPVPVCRPGVWFEASGAMGTRVPARIVRGDSPSGRWGKALRRGWGHGKNRDRDPGLDVATPRSPPSSS